MAGMREYRFDVAHKVIVKETIVVQAQSWEQAESNMLKVTLDRDMDVTDWVRQQQPK